MNNRCFAAGAGVMDALKYLKAVSRVFSDWKSLWRRNLCASGKFLPNVFLLIILLMPFDACSGGEHSRDYPAYKLYPPPVVDGILDDEAWEQTPRAQGFYIHRSGRGVLKERFAWQKPTSFSIGWCGENLYVAVWAKDPFNQLLTPLQSDGDELWSDDSVELFISPDGKSYFQFIINSIGVRWNGKDGRGSPEMWGWQGRAGISGDYWKAELEIPFSILGTIPREGDVWKFNIARNVLADPAGERHSSWAPVVNRFNDVEYFPGLEFRGRAGVDVIKTTGEKLSGPYRSFFEHLHETHGIQVRNAFFEAGLEGWWRSRPEKMDIDETTSTAGNRSIRLDGRLESGESLYSLHATQLLRLKPGTRYVFRADIKRTDFSGRIFANVVERDGKDSPWTYHRIGDRRGEGEEAGQWNRYEKRFKTSENLAEARVFLWNQNSNAVAWFDSIVITEDDGTIDEAGRRGRSEVRDFAFEVESRDASLRILLNGNEIGSSGNFTGRIREGLNVIGVVGRKEGPRPGLKVRIPAHPETDGRWLASSDEPQAAWVTENYDDRRWKGTDADDEGFLWLGGAEKLYMRQVVLWNRGHDGPDRCINPLVREWGISVGTVETLWKAVYSPFPFPVEDYEFIFEVPGDFRLLDFMHLDDDRHVLNTRPSGVSEEKMSRGGDEYRRYRISFPASRMYAREGDIRSRYFLLPVFLEEWHRRKENSAWYYRREAKGNFTELQQKIPVKILPQVDGRMPSNILISHFNPWPWVYGRLSYEHLDRVLDQSLKAGFNSWVVWSPWPGRFPIAESPYLTRIIDRVLAEKHGRIILRHTVPNHGARPHGRAWELSPEGADVIYGWLQEHPPARARFWNDSGTWDERGTLCPSYVLGEGRDVFYRLLVEHARSTLNGLPELPAVVYSNYEQAPWAGASIYRRPSDGKGSHCFCGRCKDNFREWAEIPVGADLSDGNIFSSFMEEWVRFRSYQYGEMAGVVKRAWNEFGIDYMIYTWMHFREAWRTMKGNIDLAFPGYPGNYVADRYHQLSIDREAAFLHEEAGLGRSRIMGQRFPFFHHYSWRPEQEHEEFWRKWTVLSRSGYVEPRSWKTQTLRSVASFGLGLDFEKSIEYSAGSLYWIGEATRILFEYEDIFHKGEREDDLASSEEIAYPDLLVLRLGNERVVLLFNEGDEPLEVTLRNKGLRRGQRAEVHETGIRTTRPAEMKINVPARDVAVVHIK